MKPSSFKAHRRSVLSLVATGEFHANAYLSDFNFTSNGSGGTLEREGRIHGGGPLDAATASARLKKPASFGINTSLGQGSRKSLTLPPDVFDLSLNLIKDVIIRQDPNGLSEVLFNPIASLPNAFRDNFRVGDHPTETRKQASHLHLNERFGLYAPVN
jgi:hypothetical protein